MLGVVDREENMFNDEESEDDEKADDSKFGWW